MSEKTSRKLIAFIVCEAMLFLLILGAFLLAPDAMTGTSIVILAAFVLTAAFMYVGGNIWNQWITSKYFHPELVGK